METTEITTGKLSLAHATHRITAGPTLGPEGLCLMWVWYPDSAQNLLA